METQTTDSTFFYTFTILVMFTLTSGGGGGGELSITIILMSHIYLLPALFLVFTATAS